MKPTTRLLFLSAAALCAILLTPASAAGSGNIFQSLQQPGDPCDWSGWYVGFNTGGSFNHFDLGNHTSSVDLTDQFYDLMSVVGVPGDTFAVFDFSGHTVHDTVPIGGGQTGFNLQFGHFVIGVEGGFSGNHSMASASDQQFKITEFVVNEEENVTAETIFNSERSAEIIWNGFIGGHAGFAWNRLLFYVAGGAAFTDIHLCAMEKADTSFFRPGDGAGATVQPKQDQLGGFIGEIVSKKTSFRGDVLTGWYAGGGTDWMLFKNVSMGVEYRHVDWGNMNGNFMSGGPVFPGSTNFGVSADQVMFKVNIMIAQFSPFH